MSWVLLEDTRNPVDKHKNIHEWAKENGVQIIRTKLLVGDYTLPTDQSTCVDTKNGLQEVYSNLVQEHERFRAECEMAMAAGIRLIVLVEGEGWAKRLDDVKSWKNPRREKWFKVNAAHKAGRLKGVKIPKSPPLSSDRLMAIMQTMADKYGCEWHFCGKLETGETLWELLHPSF